MLVAQKRIQYALRAVFELAKRKGEGPVKISEIAKAQSIPLRFLEVILNQLKGSGFIESKRGFYGGYYLARGPNEVSVGDIMRFMQGSPDPSHCDACISKTVCPFNHKCAFSPMWTQVHDAISGIYDRTTMQDLIEWEKRPG